MNTLNVSQMDIEHLSAIRANVARHLQHVARMYATKPGRMLDVAPQVHEGARPYFNEQILIDTFDIDPQSGCTIIGDICEMNPDLKAETYDYIVCTEVLEHTLDPFAAIREINRLLKVGGYLFLTVPFNFRIHGPLPDCWRFTEHGLRHLLRYYDVIELNEVKTVDRPLMPIHYTVVAAKKT